MSEQTDEEKKRAVEARVLAHKAKIQKEKEEGKKAAPKLTRAILEGIDFSEPVEVVTKKGERYSIDIYALDEMTILRKMNDVGIETFDELAKIKPNSVKIMDFLTEIAIESVNRGGEKFSKEELGALLKFGETFKLGNKAMMLSGFGTEEEVKTQENFSGTTQTGKSSAS